MDILSSERMSIIIIIILKDSDELLEGLGWTPGSVPIGFVGSIPISEGTTCRSISTVLLLSSISFVGPELCLNRWFFDSSAQCLSISLSSMPIQDSFLPRFINWTDLSRTAEESHSRGVSLRREKLMIFRFPATAFQVLAGWPVSRPPCLKLQSWGHVYCDSWDVSCTVTCVLWPLYCDPSEVTCVLICQRSHILWPLIHSFIPAISIAPLQVLYYSEALPTTARILCRSFTPKRTGSCT